MFLRIFLFLVILVIVNILLLHSFYLKKFIVYGLEKTTEREVSIGKVEIDLNNFSIIIKNIKIFNAKDFKEEFFFTCKKIIVHPAYNTLFKNIVEFQNLSFYEPKINLEINKQFSIKKVDEEIKDNISEAEKSLPSYKPKIYPKKQNDRNIIIKKIFTFNPKANFKYASIYEIKNLSLSDMEIYDIGNTQDSKMHFKEVFKLILLDLYFRIPDFKIKQELKKIYKL